MEYGFFKWAVVQDKMEYKCKYQDFALVTLSIPLEKAKHKNRQQIKKDKIMRNDIFHYGQ